MRKVYYGTLVRNQIYFFFLFTLYNVREQSVLLFYIYIKFTYCDCSHLYVALFDR